MNRKATWTRVKGAKPVRGPEKKPKRKFTRKESPAQAKANREYYRRRKVFMAKPENYLCRACKDEYARGEISAKQIQASVDCHHPKGRRGRNFEHLLNVDACHAMCRPHHDRCKTDTQWALKHGYIVSRLAKV